MDWQCAECKQLSRYDLKAPITDDPAVIEIREQQKLRKIRCMNLGKNLVLADSDTDKRVWKDNDSLCLKCFEQYKWEEAPGPICSYCHYEFPWIFGDQGDNCASYISKNRDYIFSAYGSSFDSDHFNFLIPPAPQLVPHSPVCDLCIMRLLEEKQVIASSPPEQGRETTMQTKRYISDAVGPFLRQQLIPILVLFLDSTLSCHLTATFVF